MAEITCFRTGYCRHPSCITLTGSGMRRRTYHAHAYLLRTAQGTMLFDTGYAAHFHDAASAGAYRLYSLVTPATCAAPLREQLRAHGTDPDAIDTIVVSHFHADHIAGLRDFPRARVICSGDAWRAVRGRTGFAAVRRAYLPALVPDGLEARLVLLEGGNREALPQALDPLERGHHLIQDEVFAVDLPGHARGHIGLCVRDERGTWTLLAADAAWHHESLCTPRGPSILSFLVQHDRRAYYRTLDLLRQVQARGVVRIRLTHDDVPDFTTQEFLR